MKKTKLVPITSLDQLEVGSIIIDIYGRNRCKILAKYGLIVARSDFDDYTEFSEHLTLESLKVGGYKLEVTEEPWMPREGERYYYPNTFDGTVGINETTWVAGNHGDNLRLKAGLVSKTKEEALAKAQKMLDSIKD